MTRLLVLAPNWLGDAVMALPAIELFAREYPGASLDIAARASVAPVLPFAHLANRVIPLHGDGRDVAALSATPYDVGLILPNSLKAALTAWRAGVRERWGYASEGRGPLLTRAVMPPRRVHQVDYYVTLVHACGVSGSAGVPTLRVTDEARQRAATLLVERGWNSREALVAMAPGAAFGGAKRWPAERFAATADALAARGARAIVVGSAADRPAGDSVLASMTQRGAMNLAGDTSLAELVGVLAHCRGLVTNDSGAMHVAAALGVPVVALFGPTRERETAPRGPARATLLTREVWCRPCMLRECPLTHACMTGITVDETVREALRWL